MSGAGPPYGAASFASDLDAPTRVADHLLVADLDPRFAVLIASPSASRIRDDAARRRVVEAARDALRRRGHDRVELVEAGETAGVTAAAAGAVAAGASTVVVAGGDGTVRDAAAPLAGTGVAIGLVPCGAGNLYAASIGLPRDMDAAVAVLETGAPHGFDLGELRLERGEAAETVPFVVACGTGFDARVMAATSREAKRRYGVAAYFLAASRLLEHLRPLPTTLTIDGVETRLDSVVVLVANTGGAIPGGIRPRLPVAADDGLLHVFVLPHGGIVGGMLGVLELLRAEAAGVSASGAGVRLAGRTVRVEVEPPGPVEVDGDPLPPAVLEARIRPGALQVIRP